MKALLINPETDMRDNFVAECISLRGKKVLAPPLGLLTTAALLPGNWLCRLVDVGIRPITEEEWGWADVAMLTGNFLHRKSLLQLIGEAKRRGKIVVVGGPYVTAVPNQVRETGADCIVMGESEPIMPELIEALETGRLDKVFHSEDKPDMTASPLPRYDLLEDMRDYDFVSVQTTRGCPFNCEFCDVIALNGRVPRFKTPAQVIAELENLYRLGWHGEVFVADDNFIGNKKNARDILAEMIRWQEAHGKPFAFYTQASVNLGQDMELLDLMTAARFGNVIVGVETPNEDILTSVRKTQNVRNPLFESITNIMNNGLPVTGTFMLGFDGETKGSGRRIADLVEAANVPIALLSTLTAIPSTSLWDRLKQEGRLLDDVDGFDGWMGGQPNFVPKRPAQEIHEEYVELWAYLYEPGRFLSRVYRCYLSMRPTRKALAEKQKGAKIAEKRDRLPFRDVLVELRGAILFFWIFGVRSPHRAQFWRQFIELRKRNPSRLHQYLGDIARGIDMFRIRDTLLGSRDAQSKPTDSVAA